MHFSVPRAAAAALLALLAALPSRADFIQVEQAPAPIPFLSAPAPDQILGAAIDPVFEASAVEPIGDGALLLVADDKTNALVVVDADTGRRVGAPLSAAAFPVAEAKWEAMARDDEGAFYVIGSHSGRPQDLLAHSFLFRFRLRGGGADGPLAIDPASVLRIDIGPGLTREGLYNSADPTRNRVRIEGLAVRTERDGAGKLVRRDLVVGLREPDDPITALAFEIGALPAGGSDAFTAGSPRRLFGFPGRTREGVRSQLSSLEYVAAWKGFLVTTSSEDADNRYHGNTLWFVADDQLSASGQATPQRIWVFGRNIKVEGLCTLPSSPAPAGVAADPDAGNILRCALVYDNDASRTRLPALMQTVTLIRWRE